MGCNSSRQSRNRLVTQEPGGNRFSNRSSGLISVFYEAVTFASSLATAVPIYWGYDRVAHRRPMAHLGDVPESAIFRLDIEKRSRTLPWVFVVLFHQRTVTSFLEL